MISVVVCKDCGRTIDNNFIYCPWCGTLQIDYHDDKYIDTVFSILEEKQNDLQVKQISEMEKQLDELDKELSILQLSSEMHK